MSKIVQVPGMGNVEFPDEMDDGAIADAIRANMPDEQNTTEEPQATSGTVLGKAAQAVAPVASEAAGAGAGLTDVAKGAAQAIHNAGMAPAGAAIKNYFSHPITNIGVDLASHAMGSPVPPMAVKAGAPYAQAVYDKYKQAMNYSKELTPEAENAIRSAGNFLDVHATPGEMREIMSQLAEGNFSKFTMPARLASSAEGQALEQAVRSAGPGLGSRIASTFAPLARTAGRVVGPVGMAMNAYDAGQMARQTELGSRLAQGQGGLAQQAYRQLPSQINTAANPQPGTPQFAALQQQYAPAKQAVQQPQMPPLPQSAAAPPTTENFIARIHQLANTYLPTRYRTQE